MHVRIMLVCRSIKPELISSIHHVTTGHSPNSDISLSRMAHGQIIDREQRDDGRSRLRRRQARGPAAEAHPANALRTLNVDTLGVAPISRRA